MSRARHRGPAGTPRALASMPASQQPPLRGGFLANWKIVAALSVVLGCISGMLMAWLGRGLVRAFNKTGALVDDVALVTVESLSYSAAPVSNALPSSQSSSGAPVSATASATVPPDQGSIYSQSRLLPSTWHVVKQWPHDPGAFTQGLVWRGDRLYEGTGMQGASRLRCVDITGGSWKVERESSLDSRYFGEGIVVWADRTATWLPLRQDGTPRDVIIQLTWQNQEGFVYDADSFNSLHSFRFTSLRNEGWGITHDGASLIVSDGSDHLFFWDPVTLRETRRVRVTDAAGRGVAMLNELEYVHGWVVANVWQTDSVVFIDPATGRVGRELDFSSLKGAIGNRNRGADVLNGIAYTQRVGAAADSPLSATPWGGRLWLTGKYWDSLFEIEINTTEAVPKRVRRG